MPGTSTTTKAAAKRSISSTASSAKSATPKRRQTATKRPVGRPRKTETFTPKRHAVRKANGVTKKPRARLSSKEAQFEKELAALSAKHEASERRGDRLHKDATHYENEAKHAQKLELAQFRKLWAYQESHRFHNFTVRVGAVLAVALIIWAWFAG